MCAIIVPVFLGKKGRYAPLKKKVNLVKKYKMYTTGVFTSYCCVTIIDYIVESKMDGTISHIHTPTR